MKKSQIIMKRQRDSKTGRKSSRFFTLIELSIAMVIFVILLVIITRFYNSAHKATSSMSEQTIIFENAKIALNLMTRDIQCIYYVNESNEKTPFWHWRPPDPANPPSSWGQYRNEFLAFVSATSVPPNDDCTSKLCEIKYQKYYATNHNDTNDGWLKRSVTGNKLSGGDDNLKWNHYNNPILGYTTTTVQVQDLVDLTIYYDVPVAAFTANSAACDNYQKVIPYVVDLSFTCFDKEGFKITPDQTISTAADEGVMKDFPFSIEISLTLMGKDSWQKWIALGGNVNPYDDTGSIKAFREKHERTFKKTVLIGNRGQYD